MVIKVILQLPMGKLANPGSIPTSVYEIFLSNFSCFINLGHLTKIILLGTHQVNIELGFSERDKSL